MGSDVSGKGGTYLKAEGDVNILAVDENHLERSKNKSSGFNAGVAVGMAQAVLRLVSRQVAMWQKAMAMVKAVLGWEAK